MENIKIYGLSSIFFAEKCDTHVDQINHGEVNFYRNARAAAHFDSVCACMSQAAAFHELQSKREGGILT